MTVERPPQSEYASYQEAYVSLVSGDVEPASALELQRQTVARLLTVACRDDLGRRYAPDKWSIRQVIGHIADSERVFAYRLLRFVRGDDTPLPGFDQDVFMAGAAFDDMADEVILLDWQSVRMATMTLVSTIDAAAWLRRGTASGQPSSARAMLYVLLGHVEHHCRVLRDRYGIQVTEDDDARQPSPGI